MWNEKEDGRRNIVFWWPSDIWFIYTPVSLYIVCYSLNMKCPPQVYALDAYLQLMVLF